MLFLAVQLSMAIQAENQKQNNASINRVDSTDRRFHDWYRFVLSFPPHLVRDYFERFALQPGCTVLDPFCGTGTTAVEAKLQGFRAIGIEANSVAHFASVVKTTWDVDVTELALWARDASADAESRIRRARSLRQLDEEQFDLLLQDSICKTPLHKLLVLKEVIQQQPLHALRCIGLLALAKTAVATASNLHFGPEVGVRGRKEDAAVVEAWTNNVLHMGLDLASVSGKRHPESRIVHADARDVNDALRGEMIDAVFTSPPYPNEKDYTRATRLESVLLGFMSNKAQLRDLKQTLVRSNTRNVYKGDSDDAFIADNVRVNEIAAEIERLRVKLKKTSGFEKLYSKVTKLYFGGMARHLADLRKYLRPGAFLGYVVGDQASFFRVHIPTAEILAEIALELGYEHVGTDLFRTRIATATRKQMREDVLLLRWPG
jgi:hypothetical protein